MHKIANVVGMFIFELANTLWRMLKNQELMMKNIFLFFLLFIWIFTEAQTFVDIHARLTGVSESASGWIDYNQDGALDIFVTGEFYTKSGHHISTKLYRNERNDKFKKVYSPITNVFRGDFDWADYDNDGDEDLFIIGQDASGGNIAKLYRNNKRTAQFTPVNLHIQGVVDGSVEWGDYDGDGDPDLLLTGETTSGPVTKIYRNDRKNRFINIKAGLPGVHFGVARWDDFDQDGDLDLIICGTERSGKVITQLFMNNNNKFERIPTRIVNLTMSDIAWGDFDNDGDDDFVITGETQNGKFQTKLYRNEKNGFFSLTPAKFANVRSGSVDWGDFDHDGDLDLLLTGESTAGPVSIIYRNDRNNVFTDINAGLMPLYMSDGHFGDYDNDGDLDVIISGMSSNYNFITKVYRNDPLRVDTVKKGLSNDNIFNYSVVVPDMPKKIYYYVFASCYCDLDNSGKTKYHVFFSPVKKQKYQYQMERMFNKIIRNNFPNWVKFDQANIISNGFSTYKKAVQSRKKAMFEYNSKHFSVHELNW